MFSFFTPPALTPLLLALVLPGQSPLMVVPIQPDGGPVVLVHRQASPLVALRLSAPVPPELAEGAVELLQELARPAASAAAARFGARLELRHEDGHAVVLVTGPAAAFDGLAWLLRQAASEPDVSSVSLLRARSRAEGRVLSRLEQPGLRVRRLLRHALHGRPAPMGATAVLLGPEAIRGLHAELYALPRLRVVMVGDLPSEAIRAAFARWPVPPGALVEARADTAPDPARSQAHHEWAAIGYRLDADPAVLAVAAGLVADRIAASALRTGAAEVWHGPAGTSLVVVGAATPGDTAIITAAGITDLTVHGDTAAVLPVSRYLRRMIAEAASLSGQSAVERTARALRRGMLLDARTQAGKADLIGRLADSYDRPDAAERVLDRLDRVTLAEVRTALAAALEAPAALVEVRP